MNQASKMHIAGAAIGILLLVLAPAAALTSAGFVPAWNEDVLNLKHETPVLEDIAETEYTARFFYQDADGEDHDVLLGATALDVAAAGVTGSTVDSEDLRILSIDLSTLTPATVDDADYDDGSSYVLVEFPETAGLLFNSTVAALCHAFEVESGNVALDEDELGRSYTLTFGAGKATLFSSTIKGDDEDGIANSNEAGQCLARSDASDSTSEVGRDLTAHDVMAFINEAQPDDSVPQAFWMKISNVRAVDNATTPTEDGDIIDVGVQFYTYPGTSGMTYATIGTVQLITGLVVLVFAILATTIWNVPMGNVPVASIKKGGAL